MAEKIESQVFAANYPKNSDTEKRELKKAGTERYAYSEIIDKFIAYKPFKVNEKAVRAASELGIDLSWDDEGNIKDITYTEAKKLTQKLGVSFLSPSDYWLAYSEAEKEGNEELLKQFKSKEFTEWLDAVYYKDESGNVFMIEHPEIIEDGQSENKYAGDKIKINMPEGRPGWFSPKNNININTALPDNVDSKQGEGSWKYWSVFKKGEYVSPIRGYVTSSGTPSYDLDIPTEAKQPVLMIREVRDELPRPSIDIELLKTAKSFISDYDFTIAKTPGEHKIEEHDIFYYKKEAIFDFLEQSGNEFIEANERRIVAIREKFIDILGIIRIIAKKKNDSETLKRLDNVSKKLFKVKKEEVNFHSFKEFISDTRQNLETALQEKTGIVFVMGHKNPDTDTAISSMTEAYRNSLIDKNSVYIPVIQNHMLPEEVRKLVGNELADAVLLDIENNYHLAKESGQAKWILVDQNVSDVQKFAISIVDHHILSEKAKNQELSLTWEMAGSTTSMIAQKFQGMGVDLDQKLGKIFYGATLMDTENRSAKKMTLKDELIMDDLKRISQTPDDNILYQQLMDKLLGTNDAKFLFERDYKEDWGFGFAVAKLKNAYDKNGVQKKENLMSQLVELAQAKNKANNYPMTLVKVVDYLNDNETVNKECLYLNFNDYVLPEFKDKMRELIEKIIRKELGEKVNISHSDNAVEYWGTGKQISRKKIAPLIESVKNAFTEYYKSDIVNINVGREFLKNDDKIQSAAEKLGIELSVDDEGRINNISYGDARLILDELGLNIMSLSEYWKILKEAKSKNDTQIIEHLQSSGFVEFLDTIIVDYNYIIDHPKVIKKGNGFEFKGEKKRVKIIKAEPGLILPDDIDQETGLPYNVRDPRQYGDKKLWRYWSPDADLVSVTRGHIFLLGQPALDTKIHTDQTLTNLGVRPCCKKIKPPIVDISDQGDNIKIVINK